MLVQQARKKQKRGNRKSYDDSSEDEDYDTQQPTTATNPPGGQEHTPEVSQTEGVTPTTDAPLEEVVTHASGSKTVTSASDMSGDQEEYILKAPELYQELSAQLKQHVTKMFFPKSKFRTKKVNELMVCKHAVILGNCRLPEGVNPDTFAKIYHKIVRVRQNSLRANTHNSAKWKFGGKCDHGHWNFGFGYWC